MYGMDGFGTALGEVTLVLFTTLAPSGVVALLLMGLPFVAGRVSEEQRLANDRFMCIPLALAMVGLIASATHLGNPANALYVLAGVGRSPLSNEVFSGVVFLGLAGIYWVTSFDERPRVALRRVAFSLIIVAGLALIAAIAFAYGAETIITWNTVYVPLALMLNALVGGPLLALFSLDVAKYAPARARYGRMLVSLSGVACVASVAVYAAQGNALSGLENHMTSALSLAPGYFGMLAVSTALAVAAVVVAFLSLKREGARLVRLLVSCGAAFAAIFIMRFAFYMTHLTVGLGV